MPYAIDFLNPAPDAEITSVGQENFDWIVNAVAEMAVKMATSGRESGEGVAVGGVLGGSCFSEAGEEGRAGVGGGAEAEAGEVGNCAREAPNWRSALRLRSGQASRGRLSPHSAQAEKGPALRPALIVSEN